MSYGIKTVVGGFSRPLSDEELIPFTLARTQREHKTLRAMLRNYGPGTEYLEVGCGYGRNLDVLNDYCKEASGIERDDELCKIASELNPNLQIFKGAISNAPIFPDASLGLILSFTFLQHLDEDELLETVQGMDRVSAQGAILILAEETDVKKQAAECRSRSPQNYASLFTNFQLIETQPRFISASETSGEFMVFRKFR